MVATQTFLIFNPIVGEMIQFDEHIFQMGWFNHQPENLGCLGCIGDEFLPSYAGIIIKHYTDPY